MPMEIKGDCKLFIGDRPCVWGGRCAGCEHYAPSGTRILIVKLAAAGDVLRTTSILPPLKRKHERSHVTWVADAAAIPLLELNPHIDRVLPFGFETFLRLTAAPFDVLICLDKEERAAALATVVDAETKLGFGLSRDGHVEPVSDGARYDFELGLSNELKFFENTKTYPEIFCEIADVPYEGDPYTLVLPDESIAYAEEFMRGLGARDPVVGLNVGAGSVFANKAWTTKGFGKLARRIKEELKGTPLVLSGGEDRDRAERVLEAAGGAAGDAGLHEILDFAAIVAMLDAVVTGDTLALHIAVAQGVPTVAVFGPTVPQEIELYGGGRKVVTNIECAPCYRRECDLEPNCMDDVSVDAVFEALKDTLGTQ